MNLESAVGGVEQFIVSLQDSETIIQLIFKEDENLPFKQKVSVTLLGQLILGEEKLTQVYSNLIKMDEKFFTKTIILICEQNFEQFFLNRVIDICQSYKTIILKLVTNNNIDLSIQFGILCCKKEIIRAENWIKNCYKKQKKNFIERLTLYIFNHFEEEGTLENF